MSETRERILIGSTATPFVVMGGISVIAGGLVSAASAPSPSYSSSWAVAYIVLVAGVGQLVLGLGQAWLAVKRPSPGAITAQAVLFNGAGVIVLVGAIMKWTVIVDAGCGLFIVALVLFLWAARGARTDNKWMLYGFRAMIAILIVSTPIGVVLSYVRAS